MTHYIEPENELWRSLGIEEALEIGAVHRHRPEERNVVILVPDDTRDVPCREAVQAILKRLQLRCSIRILIAAGSHDPCAPEALGIADLGAVHCHSAFADRNLILLPSHAASPIIVNALIAQADLVICVGLVKPHHFAGYSGGLKAILPGAAGIEFIKANHGMRDHENCTFGRIEGNPIREDITLGAQGIKARKLCLNFVRDKFQNQFWWFGPASDVFKPKALGLAAELCYNTSVDQQFNTLHVKGAACESNNLYQTTRWIAHAGRWLAPGGTMTLFSECNQGLGCPPDFLAADNFRSGVDKYLPADCNFQLQSQIAPEELAGLYCAPYVASQDEPEACITSASYILPVL